MTPRSSVAEAQRTRAAIVERAMEVASIDGLEGMTIGRLAGDLGMSKAGVIGPFGSKEALQLATWDAAVEVFRREVWEPAAPCEPGLPRLLAICRAWIAYLEGEVFPGGCFVCAMAPEFDGRPGPVRDAIAATQRRWLGVLASEARVAAKGGEIDPGRDPDDVAFELNGIAVGLNQSIQLLDDPGAARRAERAMARALGREAL